MGAAGSDDGTAQGAGQSQPRLRPPTRVWAGPREREGTMGVVTLRLLYVGIMGVILPRRLFFFYL